MSWDVPMWWSLAVSVILFLAWRQFQRQRQQKAEDDDAPLRTLAAEVDTLRVIPLSRTVSRSQPMQPDMPQRYEATFRLLPEGVCLTLRLNATQYAPLAEGQRGTLQVQGSRFVGFTADG